MPRKKTDAQILSDASEGSLSVEESKEAIDLAKQTFTVDKLAEVDSKFQLSADMLAEAVAFAGRQAEDAQISINQLTNVVNSIKQDKFVRNEDGTVNWRAMVNPKHVVINSKYADILEKKYGKPLGELSSSDIDDRFNLILLAGIKEVADLRGYSDVDYEVVTASTDYVMVKCTITWLPFEGRGPVKFSALADASTKNTDDFMSLFLAAGAENRAFIRAVRNYLKIHITGKEEICPEEKIAAAKANPPQPPAESQKPLDVLKKKVEAKGISFDRFKNWWVKEGNPEALDWEDFSDIPKEKVWAILSRINKGQ